MLKLMNGICCESTSRMLVQRPMAILLSLTLLGGLGCGGKANSKQKPASTTTATNGTSKTGGEKNTSDPMVSGTQRELAQKSDSSKGVRKSSRGIPYDAFFDNPLGELENTAVVANSTATKTNGDMPAEPSKTENEPKKPSSPDRGAASWGDLISMEVLQDEVKKVKNQLTGAMQSQKSYNDGFKDIAVQGTVLAALGGVATEHTDAASWKSNAHYVREFGSQLAESSTGPGKDNYEKSKAAFEKLSSIFNGSVPADAGDVAAKKPFHEAASRNGLMKRIEKAKEWMRLNINTEAKLKSEAEAVLHEAALIRAFGKIISQGYESADEEDYQKHAQALQAGALDAYEAVKDQSFQKFTDAINKVNKSCTDCHASYGTG